MDAQTQATVKMIHDLCEVGEFKLALKTFVVQIQMIRYERKVRILTHNLHKLDNQIDDIYTEATNVFTNKKK
jgi:hypothetical protein